MFSSASGSPTCNYGPGREVDHVSKKVHLVDIWLSYPPFLMVNSWEEMLRMIVISYY